MMRRRSSNVGRTSSTLKRRSDNNYVFDEFGFARNKRKEQKLLHRCHDYSYLQLSSVRVKELCEILSYWNGASFICRSQVERFIRMGIPPTLRGRVWKCLLNIDSLRETSNFNYQRCLLEVRGPLVDLGVSEYGILSAISTLSETQNDLGLNNQQPHGPAPGYSSDDVTLFRQIALDLQRSFPTHRSLMGDRPEAIEGQAKLFRVLLAYAKYNPEVGYSQGMSYIAAVLLMQLGEEEAFWSLAALLSKPKYLGQLFDLSLNTVQLQVKVFDQLLKHRKPQLHRHLESLGVSSVHFVMPWFLTLFTSLPCWDSVLAIWDLIMLHGVSAVFRSALTIIQLLEGRLMSLSDEGAVLPLLLRVPVDVSQYSVLVPALWSMEIQDWEVKCMNSLVLEDTHHTMQTETPEEKESPLPSQREETENIPKHSEEGKTEKKGPSAVSGAKGVLVRAMRLAQRYLLDPRGRRKGEGKASQTQSLPRQSSPATGTFSKTRTSASLSQAQIKSRRRSQQRSVSQCSDVIGAKGDPRLVAQNAPLHTAVEPRKNGPEQPLRRVRSGPTASKVARRRSNSSSGGVQPNRVKSLRLLRNGKTSLAQTSPPFTTTTSILPSSLRSSTLPPASSAGSSGLPSSQSLAPAASPGPAQLEHRQDPSRTAFIKELASWHQTRVHFRNSKESQLI